MSTKDCILFCYTFEFVSSRGVSDLLFRIYMSSLLCRFAGCYVLYKCCREMCIAVYQLMRITLLNTTPPLKQLKSFHRFRAFSFPSIFNCIVQVENYVDARGWRAEWILRRREYSRVLVRRDAGKRLHEKTIVIGMQGRAKDPRRVHTAVIQIYGEAI